MVDLAIPNVQSRGAVAHFTMLDAAGTLPSWALVRLFGPDLGAAAAQ